MIRDIAMEEERTAGEFQPDQFHKIYIHRYEEVGAIVCFTSLLLFRALILPSFRQVSILFADIKGFTGECALCVCVAKSRY